MSCCWGQGSCLWWSRFVPVLKTSLEGGKKRIFLVSSILCEPQPLVPAHLPIFHSAFSLHVFSLRDKILSGAALPTATLSTSTPTAAAFPGDHTLPRRGKQHFPGFSLQMCPWRMQVDGFCLAWLKSGAAHPAGDQPRRCTGTERPREPRPSASGWNERDLPGWGAH